MTDDQPEDSGTAADSWQEMGKRFEALGESLASAFRQAWSDEGNQQAVQNVEAGLRSLARTVATAIDEAAASPEGQELRGEAEKAVASARVVGAQAVDEAKPQLVAALQALREGLQSAVTHLQGAGPKPPHEGGEG